MSEFKTLKDQVRKQYDLISKNASHLFQVEIDRDQIVEEYLSGFDDPEERQGHNCSACKSFLRQYAGITIIENNERKSMWDFSLDEVDPLYHKAVMNIRNYINSLPVTQIFLSSFPKLGTDSNLQKKDDGSQIRWTHFYIEIDRKFLCRPGDEDSKRGVMRDNKNVLKRSLDELTPDAVNQVLELIAQNSLYRGKEFESMVDSFSKLQKKYLSLSENVRDNFCWEQSVKISQAVCKIRNSSIGTLLVDLSEGRDINEAVATFERVVAPANYKRPTPIVTARMVEEARKKIEDLGFMESLDRRFATSEDVSPENVIFVERLGGVADVFKDLAQESKINPRDLKKVEEISIEDFIEKVIPTSKSIEVLLENHHKNNMVSLITGSNESAPSMFKWSNSFSWAYTGGITDSIKEQVKAAGGRVEGELRVSLSWFNYDDLDIHVIEPNGNEIFYSNKHSHTSGNLDVDMNAGTGQTRKAVENIIWTNKSQMGEGVYKVRVHNFSKRETEDQGYIVQIECDGEIFDFESGKSPSHKELVDIVEFNYSKLHGIKIETQSKSSVVSQEKWGINTNQFHKVKSIMLSPNYWDTQTGNKHYFFFLDKCKNDEQPRGFFNEFLTEELAKERRTFEALGGKMKVEYSDNQLSGIGFSETQRNHVFVRVEGSFKRTLKVNF